MKHPKAFLDYYKKFGKPGRQRPYRHLVASERGVDYFFMVWPPGSRTFPHDHAGAYARVQVLTGSLYREKRGNFRITYAAGSEILENDSSIHAVGNDSDSEWAVSFHRFKHPQSADYKMREYPEGDEAGRVVSGDEDIVLPNFLS